MPGNLMLHLDHFQISKLLLPFIHALNFRGPIDPRILEPPKLDTTNLAARVPAPSLIMSCLLLWNALESVFNPPSRLPPRNSLAAVPALAKSKKAKPAPVSIRFIEKLFRLRVDLRLARRLTAIGDNSYEWGRHRGPEILTYE